MRRVNKIVVVVLCLCLPSQAAGRPLAMKNTQEFLRTTVGVGAVAISLCLGGCEFHAPPAVEQQQSSAPSRNYTLLLENPQVAGAVIPLTETARFRAMGQLSAKDYDGLAVYYQQGGLHSTGVAAAVTELGTDILLLRKNGGFNQLVPTAAVKGVAIDDSSYRGLLVAVPSEKSHYEWYPLPNDVAYSPDYETIARHSHLVQGEVVQAFSGGYLLIKATYATDSTGKVTPLTEPLPLFAHVSAVGQLDPEDPIPTARNCGDQCHAEQFLHED